MMNFLLTVFFYTFHNYIKPQAVPKFSLGFTVTELFWIPVNLEKILLSGEDSIQCSPQVIGSPHAHSPQVHPWELPPPTIHTLKNEMPPISGKSHACCYKMINSAVSANGIITFLINLSNLLYLFLLLYIGSLKFPTCLCSSRFETKAWKMIAGDAGAGAQVRCLVRCGTSLYTG